MLFRSNGLRLRQAASLHFRRCRSFSTNVLSPQQASSILLNASPEKPALALDASWHMPNVPRSAVKEYEASHLPKAEFFDLDKIADTSHPLKLAHMVPGPHQFAAACQHLGITKETHVVVYDSYGCFSSPRAWWTFKAFGHPNVSVLNGGLLAWKASGLPVSSDYVAPISSVYDPPVFDKKVVRSYDDILQNTKREATDPEFELVLDARSAERFHGTAPEPRAGLSSGHMPKSISVPFTALLASSGTEPPYTLLRPVEELRHILLQALGSEEALDRVLSGKQQVVTSCGSGMTAAVVYLALHELGAAQNVALYDESWTGYAMRETSPIIQS